MRIILTTWRVQEPLWVSQALGNTRCQLDLLSLQKLATFIPKLTIGELSDDSSNVTQLIRNTYSVSLLEKLHEMIRTPQLAKA